MITGKWTPEGRDWLRRMNETYRLLSAVERAELESWERDHLDGDVPATSEWPGWELYIGRPPWKQPEA